MPHGVVFVNVDAPEPPEDHGAAVPVDLHQLLHVCEVSAVDVAIFQEDDYDIIMNGIATRTMPSLGPFPIARRCHGSDGTSYCCCFYVLVFVFYAYV